MQWYSTHDCFYIMHHNKMWRVFIVDTGELTEPNNSPYLSVECLPQFDARALVEFCNPVTSPSFANKAIELMDCNYVR